MHKLLCTEYPNVLQINNKCKLYFSMILFYIVNSIKTLRLQSYFQAIIHCINSNPKNKSIDVHGHKYLNHRCN